MATNEYNLLELVPSAFIVDSDHPSVSWEVQGAAVTSIGIVSLQPGITQLSVHTEQGPFVDLSSIMEQGQGYQFRVYGTITKNPALGSIIGPMYREATVVDEGDHLAFSTPFYVLPERRGDADYHPSGVPSYDMLALEVDGDTPIEVEGQFVIEVQVYDPVTVLTFPSWYNYGQWLPGDLSLSSLSGCSEVTQLLDVMVKEVRGNTYAEYYPYTTQELCGKDYKLVANISPVYSFTLAPEDVTLELEEEYGNTVMRMSEVLLPVEAGRLGRDFNQVILEVDVDITTELGTFPSTLYCAHEGGG